MYKDEESITLHIVNNSDKKWLYLTSLYPVASQAAQSLFEFAI